MTFSGHSSCQCTRRWPRALLMVDMNSHGSQGLLVRGLRVPLPQARLWPSGRADPLSMTLNQVPTSLGPLPGSCDSVRIHLGL